MGVYIKGVTKQELKEIFGKAWILYNSTDLVEVKTPHGRLIDVDAYFHENWLKGTSVEDMPTVIESEAE